jgi:predicted nucleotidyltransferase
MNPILVQTISDYFRDKKINKAYLFGSFARGLEKDTSDIDILVELSESIGFMKLIQYKLDLEDQLQNFFGVIKKHFPLKCGLDLTNPTHQKLDP